jgi:hypothetical protein
MSKKQDASEVDDDEQIWAIMTNKGDTIEADVQHVIALIREGIHNNVGMVLAYLKRLRYHGYSDHPALWEYAAEHVRRKVAELDGGEKVIEVWDSGFSVCASCYSYVAFEDPHYWDQAISCGAQIAEWEFYTHKKLPGVCIKGESCDKRFNDPSDCEWWDA